MRSRGTEALRSIFSSRHFLLREYIHEALYHRTHGYFSQKQSPLLHHASPINFESLSGRTEYEQAVAATYSSRSHGWMTPIELFSPYLSRAIANRLKHALPPDGDVNIIEIGAGRGTLARDVLTHWERHQRDIIPRLSYYIIEISEAMTELQRKTLSRWTDDTVKIVRADAIDWFAQLGNSPAGERLEGHCHVVGMEVLDNMPHDLIRIEGDHVEQAALLRSDDSSTAPVVQWTQDIERETLAAMATFDVLGDANSASFTSALSMFESLLGSGQEIWVPTTSYRLLHGIVRSLPGASITLADFESFPGAVPGLNGPVVQAVSRGSAKVYDSVQAAPFGSVDIMFPTRFDWLARGHERLVQEMGDQSRFERGVLSQREVFERFCVEEDRRRSECKDGYNPVLEEFVNAKFLLVDGVSG